MTLNRDVDLTDRYWVFGYDDYDAYGGLEDIQATFDDLFEAQEAEMRLRYQTRCIFDSVERKFL